MPTPAFLRHLINETHKHGVADKDRIAQLQAQVHALEALNVRRRHELAAQRPEPTKRFFMYDSTMMNQIPRSAHAVAAYVNGLYANLGQAAERFPHAQLFTITITPGADADALDVENGDAHPYDCPEWVRRQHARGKARPILYANLSTMQRIFGELRFRNITRGQVLLWVANPTTPPYPHIPEGYDACQYEWSGGYDQSLCEPWFRG